MVILIEFFHVSLDYFCSLVERLTGLGRSLGQFRTPKPNRTSIQKFNECLAFLEDKIVFVLTLVL